MPSTQRAPVSVSITIAIGGAFSIFSLLRILIATSVPTEGFLYADPGLSSLRGLLFVVVVVNLI